MRVKNRHNMLGLGWVSPLTFTNCRNGKQNAKQKKQVNRILPH